MGKTLKEEFNEWLENKMENTNDFIEVSFYKNMINNELPGTEISYDLSDRKFIPQDNTSMTNYTLEYYAKFGREKFLEERELFLEYKRKKDFKDKLESKLLPKDKKIGVKKI